MNWTDEQLDRLLRAGARASSRATPPGLHERLRATLRQERSFRRWRWVACAAAAAALVAAMLWPDTPPRSGVPAVRSSGSSEITAQSSGSRESARPPSHQPPVEDNGDSPGRSGDGEESQSPGFESGELVASVDAAELQAAREELDSLARDLLRLTSFLRSRVPRLPQVETRY